MRVERQHTDTLLPQASLVDSLAAFNEVLVPLAARGLILRRPRVVGLEAKLDADRRAVRLMQRLRRRYGSGPLRLRVPGRSMALILSTGDVRQVLESSPDPFATANREKRGALSHFQPHGVLISQGRERENRRSFNEAVLDTGMPVHHLADEFVSKVNDESQALLELVVTHELLTWSDFSPAYWRIVRRVVLGDAARDDHETTNVLSRLRADANWSYFKPRRKGLQQVFEQRVRAYVRRAEKGSLAALIAAMPTTGETQPESQVGHWLFAFDAAAMATYRALALLVTHPAAQARARQEIGDQQLIRSHELPFLRASVLEAVRLWPTTPLVVRDTVSETTWNGGVCPAGTALLILSTFFHRDDQTLPYANRFEPAIWLDGRAHDNWSLIPFSAGPGACPGRNLVLLIASSVLAMLLANHQVRLTKPVGLNRRDKLPYTLNPFALRFDMTST